MRNLQPETIIGCTLREGDTRETLNRRRREFCIGISGIELDVEAVRAAFASCAEEGLPESSRRFILSPRLEAEPLVEAGMIDSLGRLVQDEWSRIWHDRCKDCGWGFAPKRIIEDLPPELETELKALRADAEKAWWEPSRRNARLEEDKTSSVRVPIDVAVDGTRTLALSLGIETLGGVSTKFLERGTTIPTFRTDIFSIAADSQVSVEIHVFLGEHAMAKDDLTLVKIQLVGIPPAPRGIPQIEVTFRISADGVFDVSAKDLTTGREQKVVLTASGGLTREEIERLRKDTVG
jgi:hypothetical protein